MNEAVKQVLVYNTNDTLYSLVYDCVSDYLKQGASPEFFVKAKLIPKPVKFYTKPKGSKFYYTPKDTINAITKIIIAQHQRKKVVWGYAPAGRLFYAYL